MDIFFYPWVRYRIRSRAVNRPDCDARPFRSGGFRRAATPGPCSREIRPPVQIEIPASPWKPAAERQRDRDAKRDAVLRTAARLFVENGFHRTKMADVAEQLHITKPALYHYFRNKEDILYACYQLGGE